MTVDRTGVCFQHAGRRLRDAERLTDSYGLPLAVIVLQIMMLPLLDETHYHPPTADGVSPPGGP